MKCIRLALMLIFAAISVTGYAQVNQFKQGDNVCFVGNSITMNGEFHHQIALFYATRFPFEKISFFNSGIGGNSSGDIIKRMNYDVLNNQPTWAVLKLGMNDVNRELYTPGREQNKALTLARQRQFDIYKKNVKQIIDTLLAHNCGLILQTPTIYDQTAVLAAPNFKGRNDALGHYSKFIKQLGKTYKLKVVDYRTILLKINKQLQKEDPTATIIGPDRVHPGPLGHFIMAWQFLKTSDAPKNIATITVDAKRQVSKTINAEVSSITKDNASLRFACIEHALPFPIAANVVPALKLVPFEKDFNQEVLQIRHLQAGRYKLTIDSTSIGWFTAAELSKGINLATYTETPQYRQALSILNLYQQYWKTEASLRGILSMEYNQLKLRKALTFAEAKQEYTRLMQQSAADTSSLRTLKNLQAGYLSSKADEPQLRTRLDSLRNAIYLANKPAKHIFEISKE